MRKDPGLHNIITQDPQNDEEAIKVKIENTKAELMQEIGSQGKCLWS